MAAPNGTMWTQFELSALERLYPSGGWEACHRVMPYRSKASIMQRASIRGLRLNHHRGGKALAKNPDDGLFVPNVRHEPLSDLDRIALREWGHITRTGQMRPIVTVELEKLA